MVISKWNFFTENQTQCTSNKNYRHLKSIQNLPQFTQYWVEQKKHPHIGWSWQNIMYSRQWPAFPWRQPRACIIFPWRQLRAWIIGLLSRSFRNNVGRVCDNYPTSKWKTERKKVFLWKQDSKIFTTQTWLKYINTISTRFIFRE